MKQHTGSALDRRAWLAATALSLAAGPSVWAAAASNNKQAGQVRLVEFDREGHRKGVVVVDKIVKTDAEWQKQLTPEQFEVARKGGTERAGTGIYANNHATGVYECVCCGTPLFDSKTKFESGTGWPSFYQPIAKENVNEKTDRKFGMSRTEVVCSRCDGHLGHVFDDGPKPTGLRYCMNSASLKFTPVAEGGK